MRKQHEAAWPPPGSAVSARPSGHLCHAAREWSPTPRNTFLRTPLPPCYTAITFVSEMCGNGCGKAEGRLASQMGPRGSKA